MEVKFNNIEEFKAAVEAGKITIPRFVSVRNYTNKNDEVSNYIINLGISHKDLLNRDLTMLNFLSPEDFKEDMPDIAKPHAEVAHAELVTSLTKNVSNNIEDHTTASRAAIETYTQLAPNVKIHNETGDIYITGYMVRKTVITPGNYPVRNKRAKTIAKDSIKKLMRSSKYRQFILRNITSIKLNGKEITFE